MTKAICFLLVAAFTQLSVAAEVSPHTLTGTLTATNNYVARGLTQTANGPAIQGNFDYAHSSGLAVGMFHSNVQFVPGLASDIESDYYANYTLGFGPINWTLGGTYYAFMLAPSTNSYEFNTFLTYSTYKLELNFTPNMGGIKKNSDTYIRGSGKYEITSMLALVGAVGYNIFGDKTLVGFKNYTDYKVGLGYSKDSWNFEYAFTNTIREDLVGTQLKDKAVVFTLARTF